MATNAQIVANKKNAQRSTGPKSTAGKARVARNALRYGLSAHAGGARQTTARVGILMEALIGSGPPDDAIAALARAAADAQCIIEQVRTYRRALYDARRPSASPNGANRVVEDGIDNVSHLLTELGRLNRYEQRAVSRRRRALRDLEVLLSRR